MKATGIVRKIDDLGRVVIPKETRNLLGVKEYDPMEIFIDGDAIILKKYNPGCALTGEMNNLIEYKGQKISKAAIEEMAKLAGIKIK